MALRLTERIRSRLPGGRLFAWLRKDDVAESGPEPRSKPLEASIRWIPVALDRYELRADGNRPHELFVRQEVLRKARDHLTGSGERFGFLLGRRFVCPERDSPWVLVSEISPAAVALPGRGENPRFRLLRAAAAEEAASRGLELIGWYHEHRHLGVTLTELDVDFHRDNFPEPWQCALIFVSGRRQAAGAFIQPWQGQRYLGRSFVSFREVVEDGAASKEGLLPSCIDWHNHAPEGRVGRVDPLGTGRGAEPAAPGEPKAARRPASGEPGAAARRESGEVAPAARRESGEVTPAAPGRAERVDGVLGASGQLRPDPPVEISVHSVASDRSPGDARPPSSRRPPSSAPTEKPSAGAGEPAARNPAAPSGSSSEETDARDTDRRGTEAPDAVTRQRTLHDVLLVLPPDANDGGIRGRLPGWLRKLLPRR